MFLTIAGVPIPVQSTNAEQQEDHRLGQIRYSQSGDLLCSLRSPKKSWPFSTRPLTLEEEASIRAAIGVDFLAKSVAGTGIGGTISALVLVNTVPYLQDGLSHQRIINFTILEA